MKIYTIFIKHFEIYWGKESAKKKADEGLLNIYLFPINVLTSKQGTDQGTDQMSNAD